MDKKKQLIYKSENSKSQKENLSNDAKTDNSNKTSDKISLKISNLVSTEKCKIEMEETQKLIEGLKENKSLLNKKLNYIKEEDDKITKFFKCFDIFEAEKIKTKMTDKMFEKKYTEKFALKYNLRRFDYLPFLEMSENLENQTLNLLHIVLDNGNKTPKLKEYCFLNEKKIFTFNFEDKVLGKLFFILEKEKNLKNGEDIFSILALNSEHFGIPKVLMKEKFYFTVSFRKEDFTSFKLQKYYDIQQLYSQINEYREKKGKSMNSENSIGYAENFKALVETLDKKINEIQYDRKEESKNEYQLRIIIQKFNRELDGFYTNPDEISIKSGDAFQTIPKNSYILVEAKNNNKLKNIITNLNNKRLLLSNAHIPLDNMYFIGILNSKPPIEEMNQKNFIKPDKFIITYSDELNEDVSQKYYSEELNYKKELIDMRKNLEEIKNDIKELKELMKLKDIIGNLVLSVEEIKKKLK